MSFDDVKGAGSAAVVAAMCLCLKTRLDAWTDTFRLQLCPNACPNASVWNACLNAMHRQAPPWGHPLSTCAWHNVNLMVFSPQCINKSGLMPRKHAQRVIQGQAWERGRNRYCKHEVRLSLSYLSWPEPNIYTIYDRTFGDFPAINAGYTVYVWY